MNFKFFTSKEEKEEPTIATKTLEFSHASLTLSYNRLTGETTPVSFTSPFIGKNIYPRCWVGNKINDRFSEILEGRIPYNDSGSRRKFIYEMNKLINVFKSCYERWDVDDTYIKTAIWGYLNSFDEWSEGVELLNIFMSATLEWLKLQESKFDSLTEGEPELRLSEEEYQQILTQMRIP
jgi:hypothetical protein